MQGLSLVSAIGHSPKIVPAVWEFAVQLRQFVWEDFRKRTFRGQQVVQQLPIAAKKRTPSTATDQQAPVSSLIKKPAYQSGRTWCDD